MAALRPRRSTRARRAPARSSSTTPGAIVGHRPARAPADLPAGRLGRARRRPRSGTTSDRVIGEALDAAGATRHGRRRRSASPTSARPAIVWDRATGEPIAPAIVWQDTRTAAIVDALAADGGADRFREQTGLPLGDLLLGDQDRLDPRQRRRRARARRARASCSSARTDTWLLWNLTGGPTAASTPPTSRNASRTLLMDLATLDWDDDLLAAFGIPRAMLPEIRSSSEVLRRRSRADPAARACRSPASSATSRRRPSARPRSTPGESKNTYGTGNFLHRQHRRRDRALRATACSRPSPTGSATRRRATRSRARSRSPARSSSGCATTSASSTTPPRSRRSPRSVDDNGGVYFVPAFSGLFAPHWRPDARGAIVGLTRFATKAHIARAALEADAFQTREVLDAVATPTPGSTSTELRVDGGMVATTLLMQFQADILGVPVVRPAVTETTALGAAYAAGLAVGFWTDLDELRANWREDTPLGARDVRRRSATTACCASGRRRSPAPSTGSTELRLSGVGSRRDPLVELRGGGARVDGLGGDGELARGTARGCRCSHLRRVLRELPRRRARPRR